MINDDILSTFETNDLTITTTLLALDIPLHSFSGDNPNKVTFTFKKDNQLEQTINEYWSGKLRVEPRKFWTIQRELKTRINSVNQI